MKIFIFCFIILTLSEIIVDTKLGKVKGIFENGLYSFKGIPYAEPPVQNLRFRPPLPKKPWTNVFDASKFGFICPQPKNWGNSYPTQSEE